MIFLLPSSGDIDVCTHYGGVCLNCNPLVFGLDIIFSKPFNYAFMAIRISRHWNRVTEINHKGQTCKEVKVFVKRQAAKGRQHIGQEVYRKTGFKEQLHRAPLERDKPQRARGNHKGQNLQGGYRNQSSFPLPPLELVGWEKAKSPSIVSG
ncbi:hypothetical protein BDZ45DRAFT_737754 [Acephala macrosclerotiorum]|nr:hypothetical protein BDZ45DRAFT_737754 [Acephala macrosclerotiorum]